MNAGSRTRVDYDPQVAAAFLRALAHPMRLRILCRLVDGEVGVAAFESEMGLKQPSLSQQLGQLREAGLVSTRREAKSIFYRLADERLPAILDTLRRSFATGAAAGDPPPTRPQHHKPMRLGHAPLASRTQTTSAPIGGECGVFSIAGWSAVEAAG